MLVRFEITAEKPSSNQASNPVKKPASNPHDGVLPPPVVGLPPRGGPETAPHAGLFGTNSDEVGSQLGVSESPGGQHAKLLSQYGGTPGLLHWKAEAQQGRLDPSPSIMRAPPLLPAACERGLG